MDIRIAEQFGNLIAAGDYRAAHTLLTREVQQTYSPDDLRRYVEEMTAYDPRSIQRVTVMDSYVLENWPSKQEGDVAWVYIGLDGEGFVEAVSLILTDESGTTRIRQLEWGRP